MRPLGSAPKEDRLKKVGVVVSCVALVLYASGCFFGTCGGADEIDELSADLERVRGTTRAYELARPDGVLRVTLTFDDGSGDSDQFATRSPGVEVMAFLSDLLVPNAYALDCGPPEARQNVLFTATWTPRGGEPEVLHDSAFGMGSYTLGARTGANYFPEATEFRISDDDQVRIQLVSPDGDARSLQLTEFGDWDRGLHVAAQLGCPEGSAACVVDDQAR
jgi:hypothetical protein